MAEDAVKTIVKMHETAMAEHRVFMRRSRAFLITFLAFCAISTAASVILLINPPPGLAPPPSYAMAHETVFLLFLFLGGVAAHIGLLAWLQWLMSRQAQRASELIKLFYELGRQVGSS